MTRLLDAAASRRVRIRRPAGRAEWLAVGAEATVGIYLAQLLVDTDVAPGLMLARVAVVGLVTLLAVVATLVRTRSGEPRTGGVPAGIMGLLLGTTGLTAGAGVGAVGLVTAGVSPSALLGVVALVAGLYLTSIGAWWLLRPLPRWGRLIGIPGALVIAQFWLLPLFMATLSTHPPRPAVTSVTPAGVERVTVRATDGTPLAGWYTPSGNGATVIVLAGAGGTKSDTTGQASVLTRHGYGILALDARGSGESGGRGMLHGWSGDADLSAAVTYLESRPEVNPARIGVLGLSMGGEVAIGGAGADPRLKAVVAEGATGRSCADLSFLPNDYEGVIHRFDSCLGWSIAGLMTNAPEPAPLTDAVQRLGTRRLLLIAADTAEEHAAGRAFQAISPATVQLWEPADTEHTAGLGRHPQEWERRVIEFLDASL